MAWTAYDDNLVQEQIALMSEPSWYSQTYITNRLAAINTILSADGATLASGQDAQLTTLLAAFNTAYTTGNASNVDRYNQLVAGYTARTTDLLANYYVPTQTGLTTLITTAGTNDTALIASYNSRAATLLSAFNGLGAQAQADVNNTYAGKVASVNQSLVNRGLGNTTISNSITQGLASQQVQDLNRVTLELQSKQMQYQSQWTKETLDVQMMANQHVIDLTTQALGFTERVAAAKFQMTAEPYGVIERRTDTTPSLADVANLTLQLGRGASSMYALPGFSPQMLFQQVQNAPTGILSPTGT